MFIQVNRDPNELISNTMQKILVVEDDKDMRRMIHSILKEEGYKIDKAYNGRHAINKIKSKNYNMVLLDYKLPDMDGLNVLKEIRTMKKSLPVIMISAYGSPSVKLTAKKLGVYRFFDKPFDLKRLVKIIKKALTIISEGS